MIPTLNLWVGPGGAFSQPFFIALLSSALCGFGLRFLSDGTNGISPIASSKKSGRISIGIVIQKNKETLLYCLLSSATVTVVVLAWTKSPVITIPFSVFSTVITWAYIRKRRGRDAEAILHVWPEVTDHLISAIHSGLSLSEALVGLGTRGPELVRPFFLLFHRELLESGDFVTSTEKLKNRLDSHGSDQILEAILLAKSLGGSELLQIFRTLGDFLREDLALRKEIEIKHGWIKNSAHLSSAAPWLLLLLLSGQPGTAEAFAQPGGIAILVTGVFLTSLAYLWMGKLGQLPKSSRVFE